MLKWIIALLAATGFIWGLSRILDALTCSGDCGREIALGVLGVVAAGLSFAYLILLFSRAKTNV